MEKKPLNKASFDDAVFENRNKSYGAYELRNLYGKRLLTAFSIALLLVIVIIFYPKQQEKPEKKYTVDEVVLSPLKKIKTPSLPEKSLAPEPEPEQKKEVKKPDIVEQPKVNESKVVVIEKKNTTEEPIQENKNTSADTNSGQKTSTSTASGSDSDAGPSDAESIAIPAIYPGCEKYKERDKLLDCFSQKLSSEINYYLQDQEWKKKSIEQIYFEIDKDGSVTNIKFLYGAKINDGLAIKTLGKIAMDFNKRTNPKRRIQAGVDALGRKARVFYRLPVRFPDPNMD